jgi:hypothetical protein
MTKKSVISSRTLQLHRHRCHWEVTISAGGEAVKMHPLTPQFIHRPHNPTTTPKTTTATKPPMLTVLLPAAPVSTTFALALASATCSPNAVVVAGVPLTVVVTTLVAVVSAEHPLQLVHGAELLHGPAVQPGQSDGGHALPPHQAVQGPDRQSERVDHSL